MKVIKRNGSEVDFDLSKIINAISKAKEIGKNEIKIIKIAPMANQMVVNPKLKASTTVQSTAIASQTQGRLS